MLHAAPMRVQHAQRVKSSMRPMQLSCASHAAMQRPCTHAGPGNTTVEGGLWPQIALDVVYTGKLSLTASTKVGHNWGMLLEARDVREISL